MATLISNVTFSRLKRSFIIQFNVHRPGHNLWAISLECRKFNSIDGVTNSIRVRVLKFKFDKHHLQAIRKFKNQLVEYLMPSKKHLLRFHKIATLYMNLPNQEK